MERKELVYSFRVTPSEMEAIRRAAVILRRSPGDLGRLATLGMAETVTAAAGSSPEGQARNEA